ncbi:MAG: hypothetical protein NZ826_05005 [Thermodesulfovibrio sp.]|nr:hypothetical protein [Thermodesulfovibrio sp.]
MKSGDKTIPVRINRISGYTEYLLFNKWIPTEDSLRRLPQRELERIEIKTETIYAIDIYDIHGKKKTPVPLIPSKVQARVYIYNGSDWYITKVNIAFIFQKERTITKHVDIPPNSIETFEVEMPIEKVFPEYTGVETLPRDGVKIKEILGYKYKNK